jgi:hypothetical protein
MVAKAEEYALSSAQFHLGLVASDPLVRDRTMLGLVEDWAEYLSGSDEATPKAVDSVRSAAAGSDQFVKVIENLTQRDLGCEKRDDHRPPKVAS